MLKYTTFNKQLHRFPLVVSFPHSGTQLTDAMQTQLLLDAVLSNTDWFLPELYSFLTEMGVTVLQNHMSRYVVDPNRSLALAAPHTNYRNTLIYRTNTWGSPIYKTLPDEKEIQNRILDCYEPYHDRLLALLEKKRQQFGKVFLLDCHSFADDRANIPFSVVLGDRFGTTCSEKFTETVQRLLEAKNFTTCRNDPYAGGYITEHYGSLPHIEALQIELQYQCYIEDRSFGEEEVTHWNPALFQDTQRRLQDFFTDLLPNLITL